MSDKAIENALRHRDDLAKRINQAQQQIEEWRRAAAETDAFIEAWHKFADGEQAFFPSPEKARRVGGVVDPIGEPMPLPEKVLRKRAGANNSSKEAVARVTQELIAVHGQPIQRPVLLNLLRERGLVIEGAEPETVLSTMLWRMGKEGAPILHLKGIGYWDAEKDWPDARHFPSVRKKLDAEGVFKDLDAPPAPRSERALDGRNYDAPPPPEDDDDNSPF